jgi:hypothetical protein
MRYSYTGKYKQLLKKNKNRVKNNNNNNSIIYEINNKGLKRPKFRVTNFKKSFFHVSQTEPRNTH